MATVDGGSPLVGSQSSVGQEEDPTAKVSQGMLFLFTNLHQLLLIISLETPFDADMIVDIITGLEVTVKSRNWEEDDKMLIPKDYSTSNVYLEIIFIVVACEFYAVCRTLVSV